MASVTSNEMAKRIPLTQSANKKGIKNGTKMGPKSNQPDTKPKWVENQNLGNPLPSPGTSQKNHPSKAP